MKSLIACAALLASLVIAGCGSKEEPSPDAALPPAKDKAAGEAAASASGGGQFGRTSDKADAK